MLEIIEICHYKIADLLSDKIGYIELEIHSDDRGNLIALEESSKGLPFTPQRSFYLFDVPQNAVRAGHAVDSELFFLAINGSVIVENEESASWKLDSKHQGLYIPPKQYIELNSFSSDAIIVVYASKKFDETNYFSLDEVRSRK